MLDSCFVDLQEKNVIYNKKTIKSMNTKKMPILLFTRDYKKKNKQ